MTSPLALLAPIAGGEAPAQTEPAADPAVFGAALVAALQGTTLPLTLPLMGTSLTTPSQEPPVDDARPDTDEAQPDQPPGPDGTPASATPPASPVSRLPARWAGAAVHAPPAAPLQPVPEVGAAIGEDSKPVREPSIATRQDASVEGDPVAAAVENSQHREPGVEPAAPVEHPREPRDPDGAGTTSTQSVSAAGPAVRHVADGQVTTPIPTATLADPTATGAGPILFSPSEAIDPRLIGPARAGESTGRARPERERSADSAALPLAPHPVPMMLPTAPTPVETSVEPVAEAPAENRLTGLSAREPEAELLPATPWRAPRLVPAMPEAETDGLTPPTRPVNVATRELADTLGEAEITAFRVEIGSRRAPNAVAAPPIPLSGLPAALRRPMADVPEAQGPVTESAGPMLHTHRQVRMETPVTHAPVSAAGEPAAALATRAYRQVDVAEPVVLPPVPSQRQLSRGAPATPAVASEAAARTLAPSPMVAHPPARILPASRQELPAQDRRPDYDPGDSRALQPAETERPSDSSTGAWATVPGARESFVPGGIRAGVRSMVEARNVPEGGEVQEKPAGLADRVTLQVADADGRSTRIRVTVLGDQVRALILPPDGESAGQLQRRMDELQAALVRHGFVDSRVTVQPAGREGVPWGTTPTGAEAGPTSSRSTEPPSDGRHRGGRDYDERQGDGSRHPRERGQERDRHDRRR